MPSKKGAAGPWGRTGRSRTRPGDGEGWGRDREREFLLCVLLSSAVTALACGYRGRGLRFAESDPFVRIGLGLPLDEAVAGFVPGQDFGFLVVENEFAAIGLDREHGVAVALFV